ncbi:Zonula occludens toxin family protein [Georgfuchsia toluolica]|uniref:Zonula occludens toxin family protein n=1 Tax=Georgfuchsia toluolica TaxID=424218 RepID=A0A916J2J8_9PROT|nr:zonular occludens toxin domain-containing protein [Georgfuchsia toluolica]CAG4882795.1 Zonula occludens toxin family protein [Georgfuchsia toluolica]
MIEVITGVPGTGKTALVVERLLAEQGKRPIFCMGIRELKIPHQPVPPVSEWTEMRPTPEDPTLIMPFFTFPVGSLIVIDEAQNVYRPRANSAKVPDHVAANETHRHTGVDFILLTQSVKLIDSNIKAFVSKHTHISQRVVGRYKYVWPEMGDPESKTSRDLAARSRYMPNKKVFGLYKSAEAHTKIHVSRPWYVYALPICLAIVAFLGWHIYGRIQQANQHNNIASKLDRSSGGAVTAAPTQHLSLKDYLKEREPRLQDHPETAPVYDDVNKVAVAPLPAVCYSVRDGSTERCYCRTQQGTRYGASDDFCHEVVRNGWFNPYQQEPVQSPLQAPVKDSSRPDAYGLLLDGEAFPREHSVRTVDASVLATR